MPRPCAVIARPVRRLVSAIRVPRLASLCEGGVKTKGFDGGRDVIRSFLSPSQRFALPAPSQRGPRNHTSASLFAAAFALKCRAVHPCGLWQNRFSNSGHRPPPTFAASRQRCDLIIAHPRGGCFQRGRAAALPLWSFQGEPPRRGAELPCPPVKQPKRTSPET